MNDTRDSTGTAALEDQQVADEAEVNARTRNYDDAASQFLEFFDAHRSGGKLYRTSTEQAAEGTGFGPRKCPEAWLRLH